MIAKKSTLQFKDIVISQSSYRFQPFPEQVNIPRDVELAMSTYEIDIDFVFRKSESNENATYLFTKISINKVKEPLAGYSIFAECMGYIPNEVLSGLDDKAILNQINIPSINIAINFLRGYVANLTAYGPLGKYLLPAINLAELLKSKTAGRIEKEDTKGLI